MIPRLFSFLIPNLVYTDDIALYVNPADLPPGGVSQTLLRNHVWAASETKLLKEKIKKGQTIVDIGGNIGYHTLLLSKLVGKAGKVISFEPDYENYKILIRNIQENNASNVHSFQMAVGSKMEWLNLYISKDNKGDHRSYDSRDGREKERIMATSLDDFLEKTDIHVDFIKMDIQGFEYQALMGMKKLLSKQQNIELLLEYWPYGLTNAGTNPMNVLKFLDSLGFTMYELYEHEYTLTKMDPKNFQERSDSLIPGDMCTNIYCKRL